MNKIAQCISRDKKQARSKAIQLKLSCNEDAVIRAIAAKCGHSVSGTVRRYMRLGLEASGVAIPSIEDDQL